MNTIQKIRFNDTMRELKSKTYMNKAKKSKMISTICENTLNSEWYKTEHEKIQKMNSEMIKKIRNNEL